MHRFLLPGALLACPAAPPPQAPEAPPRDAAELLFGLDAALAEGSLDLSGQGLDDDLLAAVLADPRVERLVTVNLSHNRLTDRGLRALLEHPGARGIAWLNLAHNPIGDAGAAHLADAALPDLRQLFVGDAGLGPAGARALVEAAARVGGIAFLSAGDQQLGDQGAEALAGLPGIDRLELPRAGIGGRGARALLQHAAARVLVLEGNPIGPGGLAGLASLAPSLAEVSLASSRLGPEDARALAAIPAPAALAVLDLTGNPLGNEGIAALAATPWLQRLERLDAYGSGADKATRDALVEAWGVRSGIWIERR